MLPLIIEYIKDNPKMENVVTNSQIHEHSIMHRVILLFRTRPHYPSIRFSSGRYIIQNRATSIRQGTKSVAGRRLPEATELFEKVLEIEPNSYDTRLRLAQIYELQRKTDLARKHYYKAVSLKANAPQSAPAFQWIGRDHFNVQRYDSAQFYFEKALALFPPKLEPRAAGRKSR